MNKFNVVISEHAQQDLRDLSNTISFELSGKTEGRLISEKLNIYCRNKLSNTFRYFIL